MAVKTSSKLVFFNASVILAGLASPTGASAEILSWVKKGKIAGAISEIILDEVKRRSGKIGIPGQKAEDLTLSIFHLIHPPPAKSAVVKYDSIVSDLGDSHVLASADETAADFLVSLDKKHILILEEKIKKFKIVSPGKLIQTLRFISRPRRRQTPQRQKEKVTLAPSAKSNVLNSINEFRIAANKSFQ